MDDHLDVEVHDSAALDEIALMTDLIIASSEADGHLSLPVIDEILGVDQPVAGTDA